MEKSLFEQMGCTYTEQGDYRLPNLVLPLQTTQNYSIWGYRRLRFLKAHHKLFYYNLLTAGKLEEHLADVDGQAEKMYLRLVEEMRVSEGITEKLKAENQMEWVKKMNNIAERAWEIINKEIIFKFDKDLDCEY